MAPFAFPDERLFQRLLLALLILGAGLRLLRYAVCFPLWDDETALVVHLLERGYWGLTQPLGHEQVCPVGFLWLQKAAVDLLGFSEYSVRLPAFLAGLASLLLFSKLTGYWLRGLSRLAAVGIFSVAYPLVRYGAEAKPYGFDAFCALLLLCLASAYWHERRGRYLVALIVLTPLALFCSYPAMFVAGGVSVFLGWGLCLHRRGIREGVLIATYGVVLAASAFAVIVLFASPQSATHLNAMRGYWGAGFPPLASPLDMPYWLLSVHSGQMMAYPVGSSGGGSAATFVFFLLGVLALGRQRQGPLIVLCLAPLGVNFLAAALARYPYGGPVRFQLFAAACFCLLAGAGLGATVEWFALGAVDRKDHRRRLGEDGSDARGGARGARGLYFGPACGIAAAMAVLAVGTVARDLVRPTKGMLEREYRDAVRRAYADVGSRQAVNTLDIDLTQPCPETTVAARRAAMFLCNQAIYGKRDVNPLGQPLSAAGNASAGGEGPWIAVALRVPGTARDRGVHQWLDEAERRATLAKQETIAIRGQWGPVGQVRDEAYLDLYYFQPVSANPTDPAQARDARLAREQSPQVSTR